MWKDMIEKLYADAEFEAPASDYDLDQAEVLLDQAVPQELRDLLATTNGVRADWGSGLVWSVEEIIEQNTEFRHNAEFAELYASFDQLLFFADNGGGDQFAYLGSGQTLEVHVWDHETDERKPVASSLADYLRRRAAADEDDWYR